ncbi:MAG: (Fe-S)-binding protein [Victivallaceae bacterium]|nr:(Fe-S)-binding protein [Victivallaceae bacterium]
MTTFLAAVAVTALIALVLGVVIGVAARIFRVKSDARVELVIELLPGANCGGCGFAGCADFAKALVEGKTTPSRCAVSSQGTVAAIASALGVSAGDGFRQTAVVLCGGDRNQIHNNALYNGVADCVSAALIGGGFKGCEYGCLGMGSCARACPFGAIEIVNNLAIVHAELCVGCGKCVATCPRKLIRLVPAGSKVHVYCSSPRKGAEKRKVCDAGCIGCRKCQKLAPEVFEVAGTLAHVKYDHDHPADPALVEQVGCPTDALLTAEQHLKIEHETPEGRQKK